MDAGDDADVDAGDGDDDGDGDLAAKPLTYRFPREVTSRSRVPSTAYIQNSAAQANKKEKETNNNKIKSRKTELNTEHFLHPFYYMLWKGKQ